MLRFSRQAGSRSVSVNQRVDPPSVVLNDDIFITDPIVASCWILNSYTVRLAPYSPAELADR